MNRVKKLLIVITLLIQLIDYIDNCKKQIVLQVF